MKFSGQIGIERAERWTSWYGGEMPVPAGTKVHLATRYTDATSNDLRAECEAESHLADDQDWPSKNLYHSITAYRVVSS